MVVAAGAGLDIIHHPSNSGWFDTELDTECVFVPDEVGVERCFPFLLGTNGANGIYADASCTQPVLLRSGSGPCDAPRFQYVRGEAFGADGCGHRGFHIGSELPAATPLFVSSNGTCMPDPLQRPSDTHVYALEPLAADTFVAMQRVRQERVPGMDAFVREGEDGSWQVVDFFDTRRGGVCRDLSPHLVPHSMCVPITAAFTRDFADAACETRAAEVLPLGGCRPPLPDAEPPTAFDPPLAFPRAMFLPAPEVPPLDVPRWKFHRSKPTLHSKPRRRSLPSFSYRSSRGCIRRQPSRPARRRRAIQTPRHARPPHPKTTGWGAP
jgi:hypothetical protein